MVEMRATVNGREIEDAITGEQMENLRRFADGFCSQDVLNYFSDMGETYWIAFNGLNAMTVD